MNKSKLTHIIALSRHASLLAVAAVLVWAMGVSAAPLTRQQAMTRASHQLESMDITVSLNSSAARVQAQCAPYYMCTSGSRWAIIAGDDQLPPVLGYGDSGLTTSDAPQGFIDLLDEYRGMAVSDVEPLAVPTSPVAPLLKSRWGQAEPYNLMCPRIDSTTWAPTGSVATAMGQVMYFHRWPLEVTATIPAYQCNQLMTEIEELDGEHWPLMGNVMEYYTSRSRDSLAVAAARFMCFAARSLRTDFGQRSSASSAHVPFALHQYFGYKPSRYVQRQFYTADEWLALIVNELKARRPVIYRSNKYNGTGQAFVIDGVDRNGLFHINWGWHGACDGYYALTDLVPQGTVGEEDGARYYDCNAAMVIGIEPDRESQPCANTGCLSFYNMSVPATQYSRSDADCDFNGVMVCGRFNNGGAMEGIYDIAFQLVDNAGNVVRTMYCNTTQLMLPGYGVSRNWSLTIGHDVPQGSYTLLAASRLRGSSEWHRCIGAQANSAVVTIGGNTLSIQPQGNSAQARYAVDKVDFEGSMQAGRNVKAIAGITATGQSELGQIYLTAAGTTTATQCSLMPGCSGSAVFNFAPAAGTHTVTLSLDEQATDILWQGTISIADPPRASLQATAQVRNTIFNHVINSDVFAVNVKLENLLNTSYDDIVVARLYRDGYKTPFTFTSQHVHLEPRGKADVTLSFDNLKGDEKFSATIGYYDRGILTQSATTAQYTMRGSFPTGDINQDWSVDITDSNILINIMLRRDSEDNYNGRSDVTGDGVTDVSDSNAVTNIMLKKD